MKGLSTPLNCRTTEDWVEKLTLLFESAEARKKAGREGKAITDAQYGTERILASWDSTFQSLF
jgi:hypothetical protein